MAALRALFFLGHLPGRPLCPIIYPREPKERPHLAYYGTTRSGKTFGIEWVLRQLCENRNAGFAYVDPHGSSYWRMASYLRQMGVTDRVLYWDLNDPEFVTTYDPFSIEGQSPAYIAGNLTAALLATLGRQAGAADQPHLKTTTEAGLLSLLTLGLPFALARHLFDPQDTRIKKAITERLQSSTMLGAIAELPRLLDRYHELAAPFRRFDNLFRDERLKLTFTTAGLNFRDLMDEGWIILINAEPKDQYDEAVTLFIRLLVKTMFMAAKQRPKSDETRPFFLAIDEASRYLTADTARILAETAGYGLYLLVGMQSLEQARLESEESYVALRANVNGEIVMRIIDHEEKLYFARRFFGDRLDFTRIKHEEFSTSAIPRVVGRTTSSHSESVDENDRWTVSDSESSGYGIDYDYRENRTVYFYTADELERMDASRFSVRDEGQAQRFGIVRVNESPPTDIEIPAMPPPSYSRDEMQTWLRTIKQNQAATLPLIEARHRFDALLQQHVELLTSKHFEPEEDELPRPSRLKPRRTKKNAPEG
ncbi:type IV secretory system conjugative DNA transfer family protein [bacterium]|nr:type IV secretory system conjugative DNA transfer family protein [bacterium]